MKSGLSAMRVVALVLTFCFAFNSDPALALRPRGPEAGTPTQIGLETVLGGGLEETPLMLPGTPMVLGAEQVGILHSSREAGEVEKGDCGVFVRVGLPAAQGGLPTNQTVLAAARALEPRGYQSSSAGVVVTGGDGASFKVHKSLGDVNALEQILTGDPLPEGPVQLVHLRWPTQGEASYDNQHPTVLREGQQEVSDVELVFNGDILNYRELDDFLAQHGILRPESVATDAWTIGALIWYYYRQPNNVQKSTRAAQIYFESGRVEGRDKENWAQATDELIAAGVHMPLLEAVALAYQRLEGDFALIAVSEQEPDKAIGALRGQKPLVVGRGKSDRVGNFIASEASTFIDHTDLNQPMRNGDIVVVTKDAAQFYRLQQGQNVGVMEPVLVPEGQRPVQQLDAEEVKVSKGAYTHYTMKEIDEQPRAIENTIQFENRIQVILDRANGTATPMPGINLTDEEIQKATKLLIIAMGTATHAAEAARPFLTRDAGLATETTLDVETQLGTTLFDVLKAEIFDLVRRAKSGQGEVKMPADLDRWLKFIDDNRDALAPIVKRYEGTIGIAVSQSGNTMDTNQLVVLLQKLGVKVIGIVNKPIETPLVRLTRDDGGTFRTKAGAEVGVASTKAYVAQVTAFRVLSIYLGQVRGTLAPAEARQKLQALRQLPKQVEVWLKTDKNRTFTQQIADQMAGQQTLMFLGRGSMVPVAKEGALKMLELAYVFTSGMDLALMKHGFIANFPESRNKRVKRFAIVPLTDRVSFTEALGNLSEIRARYGGVVAICYEADRALAAKNADFVITVPDVLDELAAIVAVVPLQLLAVDTTLAINRVSEEIASLAEQLYMLLQQRGTAAGPSDADILKVVTVIQRRFEKLLREGRLDLLPASLIADVQQKITETSEATTPGAIDESSRELIRVLRGPRLSMIMFFDHELTRMTSTNNGDVHLKANEGEVLRGFFQQAAASSLQPGAVLNQLQQQLSVFLAQAASRGSGLKSGWKEWRFDKGLAEFLARDLDKPRGLAKEVTVDRLSSDLRHELSEMGVPPELMDSAFLGTMELAGARMREYPGVVRLVANLRGVPESTVRRQAAMHEQAHYILRSLPVYPEILAAADEVIDEADLNGIVADAANYVPFRDRFEQVYGAFDVDAAYLDEVLAKYASARLTGVGIELFDGVAAELDKVLAGTTFNWSDELKGKVAAQLRVPASELDASGKLPQNLAELFGIDFLPQYGPRVSNSSAEVRKAVQLSRFAVALGMNPAIDVRADEQVSADLQQLLANLGHAVRAEAPVQVPAFAGLEQPLPAQLMAERISLPSAASIASSIGVVAGTSDRKGLAYGVALTRVTTSDGTALPVAFVVDTAQQQANLQQMGISPNAIFRAGTPEYGTAADAVAAASRWLTGVYSVGQVVDIGATRPIAQRIQQLLDTVFGIKITSEAAALWDSFIDRATLALQA